MCADMPIFLKMVKQLTETYSRNNKDTVIIVCHVYG